MFRGLWWSEVAAGTEYVEAADRGTHGDRSTGSRCDIVYVNRGCALLGFQRFD